MFRLRELLKYDGIVIQCHDIPDADTIASAFAIHTYLKNHDKQSRIIYSGKPEITKASLLEMIEKLSIPIEYVEDNGHIRTLVLVDCQYGEKNVRKFTADTVIVIDHHIELKKEYDFGIIQSGLGSCSTLVWDLLGKENFDFESEHDVSTALYYGLYTDTTAFDEIAHPLDKDMRDGLKFNADIIKRLKNNNFNLSELKIAGSALANPLANKTYNYAIIYVEPCDPNILGFVSDLALQTSGIDVCVVYNELNNGYKLSVRSCIREIMANEFIRFLVEGVGSGGGHISKAGGFISKSEITEKNIIDINEYIEERIQAYFNIYDIIDAKNHNLDAANMAVYEKKKIPVSYVRSTDVFDEGTPVLIRTLEGDAYAAVSDKIYFMIGIKGEVYPIKAEKFANSYADYDCNDEDYKDLRDEFTYSPTIKNQLTGESVAISDYAKPCITTDETRIYAVKANRHTKVLTAWNMEGYMYCEPGDYIAVRTDDFNDVYIIEKDIFAKTYERV